jgi:ribonuclease P protein component
VAEAAPDRRLSRRDRLRSRKDFERLLREGERRASGRFVVFLGTGPRPGLGEDAAGARPRLGVTASRKVGNAVVRNRVKRRIRAAFRARRGLLPPASDVVVIARPGAAGLGGRSVERELADLFGREPSR